MMQERIFSQDEFRSPEEQLRIKLKPRSPYKYIESLDELKQYRLDNDKILRHHQLENMLYIAEKSNFRGAICDDTGLGKTISACALLHKWRFILFPAIVVCKAALKIQWYIELKEAIKDAKIEILSNKDVIPDEDTDIFIVSYDNIKKMDLDYMDIQTIILDEVQMLKNWNAQRTVELVDLCKRVPYVIPTSATPAKNNAGELYPMFHILRPDRFQDRKDFLRRCETVSVNGAPRIGGISRYYQRWFDEVTQDLLIRHTREEVAPDLPRALRNHFYVDISDKSDVQKIKKEMEHFISIGEELGDKKSILGVDWEDYDPAEMSRKKMELRASMLRMYHLIGNAKVPHAVEFIKNFLQESEDRKFTAYVHHRSVGEGIYNGIMELIRSGELDINPPYVIRGGMNEDERNSLVRACTVNGGWPSNDKKSRLLIASTLAAGEGINLQKCYDSALVERQFNAVNEDQATPGRHARIGADKDIKNIFITYITGRNTLDQWFDNTVTFKRKIISKTMDGEDYEEVSRRLDEADVFSAVQELMLVEGRKWLRKA